LNQLSNNLKRLMKAGAILFGLIFIVSGIIGIHQDDTFLPTKGVIQSMERTYVATDSNETDTWEVMVEYTVDGKTYVSDLGQKKDDFTVGKEIALLQSSGVHVHEEDAERDGKLAKMIPARGYFRIQTREKDLDLLFVIAMAFARTSALDGEGGSFGLLFGKK